MRHKLLSLEPHTLYNKSVSGTTIVYELSTIKILQVFIWIRQGFNVILPSSSSIWVLNIFIGFHTTDIEKYGLKSYLYGISSVMSFGSMENSDLKSQSCKSWVNAIEKLFNLNPESSRFSWFVKSKEFNKSLKIFFFV